MPLQLLSKFGRPRQLPRRTQDAACDSSELYPFVLVDGELFLNPLVSFVIVDRRESHSVPEPALEFAALSTKAASEKKPETLQCSISAVEEADEEEDEELRPVSPEENLQAFQRSLLVRSGRWLCNVPALSVRPGVACCRACAPPRPRNSLRYPHANGV